MEAHFGALFAYAAFITALYSFYVFQRKFMYKKAISADINYHYREAKRLVRRLSVDPEGRGQGENFRRIWHKMRADLRDDGQVRVCNHLTNWYVVFVSYTLDRWLAWTIFVLCIFELIVAMYGWLGMPGSVHAPNSFITFSYTAMTIFIFLWFVLLLFGRFAVQAVRSDAVSWKRLFLERYLREHGPPDGPDAGGVATS